MRTVQLTLDEDLVKAVDKVGGLVTRLTPGRMDQVRSAPLFAVGFREAAL